MRADDPRMPVVSTMVHALLRIVTVALGSPLGREVAPRETGAMWAGWLAHRLQAARRDARAMVACGAGAGLAAVYNVPLGGALFVLEASCSCIRRIEPDDSIVLADGATTRRVSGRMPHADRGRQA